MRLKSLCLWLILILLFSFLKAQEFPMRHYDFDDGLAHDDVYTAYQDKQGYLWFGTYGGLSRFNGKSFKSYTSENSQLEGNVIKSIVQDAKGNLWVGYNGGVARLEEGKFVHYDSDQGMVGTNVSDLWAGPQQGLWAFSNQGANYFDGESFQYYSLKNLNLSLYSSITGTPEGEVFVASKKGVYQWKPGQKDFTLLPTTFHIQGIQYSPQEKVLYVISDIGLYQLENQKFVLLTPSPLEGKLIHFSLGKEGNLWVVSESELWKWSPRESNVFTNDMLQRISLSGVLEDQEGNLWLTSWGGAAILVHEKILNYSTYLPGRLISSIGRGPNGYLWVAGEHGIVAFNEKNEPEVQIESGFVNQFLFDKDRIFSATDGNGLQIYDLKGKLIQTISPEDGFTAMLRDRQGKLWVSTYEGLHFLQGDQLVSEMNMTQGLGSNTIWSFLEDWQGKIWVGTENGLSSFFQGRWKHYQQKDGLLSSTIWSLLDHPHWGVIVGTEKGMNQWNGKQFETFPLKKSEDNPHLYSLLIRSPVDNLLVDSLGKLWVGSKWGIFRINQDYEIDLFLDKSMGLPDNTTYSNSNYQEQGVVYFGTHQGMTTIQTDVQNREETNPKLIIEHIEIQYSSQGKSGEQDSRFLSHLNDPLDYSENNLRFVLQSIYMSVPEKIRYRYYLEGLDQEWSLPSTLNQAVYTNLPHGVYTFRAQAVIGEERVSQTLSIPFQIQKPFWLNWWFLFLEVVFAVLFLIGVVRYWGYRRVHIIQQEKDRIKREKDLLEHKVETRTKELRQEVEERERMSKIFRQQTVELQNDLRLAREFQKATLSTIPRLSFLKIIECYLPLSMVSGDTYSVRLNRDGNLNIFLGDATGHGVSAAFLTMMVQISLENIRGDLPTNEVLHKLNQLLASQDTGKSITGVYLRMTPEGKLTVSHAGHPPLILIPADGSFPVLCEEGGCPLGMFLEEPVPYIEETYQLEVGDRFFIYSDGFLEWENKEEQLFSLDRLVEFFIENRKQELNHKFLDHLFESIVNFSEGNERGDDITLLGFQFEGKPR